MLLTVEKGSVIAAHLAEFETDAGEGLLQTGVSHQLIQLSASKGPLEVSKDGEYLTIYELLLV